VGGGLLKVALERAAADAAPGDHDQGKQQKGSACSCIWVAGPLNDAAGAAARICAVMTEKRSLFAKPTVFRRPSRLLVQIRTMPRPTPAMPAQKPASHKRGTSPKTGGDGGRGAEKKPETGRRSISSSIFVDVRAARARNNLSSKARR